jgi:hypothetical protein
MNILSEFKKNPSGSGSIVLLFEQGILRLRLGKYKNCHCLPARSDQQHYARGPTGLDSLPRLDEAEASAIHIIHAREGCLKKKPVLRGSLQCHHQALIGKYCSRRMPDGDRSQIPPVLGICSII